MADMKKNEGQGQQGQGQQGQQGQQGAQNVPVRQQQRDTGTQRLARNEQQQYRSPFQLMREMLRDPFGSMMPMQNDLETSFEVRETKDSFVFKADVPGINKEDIDIQLHGNRLAISGKREQEMEDRDQDRFYAYERSYGSFTRVFTLPEQADTEHVRTDLKDGVLTLVVPKKPGAQPRKIEIGSGQGSKS
jgi:HSP20 family protein